MFYTELSTKKKRMEKPGEGQGGAQRHGDCELEAFQSRDGSIDRLIDRSIHQLKSEDCSRKSDQDRKEPCENNGLSNWRFRLQKREFRRPCLHFLVLEGISYGLAIS